MRVKFFLWLIGIGLVVGIYGVVTRTLQERLEVRLTHSFDRPVKIREVHVIFPPALLLLKLTVEDSARGEKVPLLSIQQTFLRLSFLKFLQGQRGIDLEFTSPELFVTRSPQGTFSFPLVSWLQKNSSFSMTRLRIRNGEVKLTDQAVSPETIWIVRDLRLSMVSKGNKPQSYLVSAIGSLEADPARSIGSVEIDGEFVPAGTTQMKVSITQTEIERLAPYIRQIIGVAPSQGSCAIKSAATLQNGAVVAHVDLTAHGIMFPTNEETIFGLAGNRLVELLKDKDGSIHLAFDVKGRLGESLDWSNATTAAFREAMRQALSRSIQNVLTDVEERRPVEELLQRGMESLGR